MRFINIILVTENVHTVFKINIDSILWIKYEPIEDLIHAVEICIKGKLETLSGFMHMGDFSYFTDHCEEKSKHLDHLILNFVFLSLNLARQEVERIHKTKDLK
jgi:hypothetical protein